MLLNRVFQDPSTGKRYRVVLEHLSDLMLIDVDSDKAWPFPMSEEEFRSVGYDSISDPYPIPSVEDGSVGAARRDEAWATISPLLEHYQSLLIKNERNRLIKELLKSTDKPRLYITRQLRRYWQREWPPMPWHRIITNVGPKAALDVRWSKRLAQNVRLLQEWGCL